MDVPAKGNVLGRVVPARYILAILGSIGMAIVYGLKVNLSVAIVGMLNYTAIKDMEGDLGGHGGGGSSGVEECSAGGNATDHVEVNLFVAIVGMLNYTTIKDMQGELDGHGGGGSSRVEECSAGGNATDHVEKNGPFAWSSSTQGIVMSCYFWGYFVAQIPGARVAELFSAKWVMFFSVTINVVCTLLTPVMATLAPAAVVIMRIGEGIGGGVTFPAMHVLLSKWAPPAERSVMAALVYAGTSLGTVISMLLAGILAANINWESVFYVMGGLASIWCLLWVVLVQDSPQEQRLISAEERNMIVTSLGGKSDDHGHKKLPVPWRAVLTSPPFLAILVAHACSNWGWYMLLIELPTYMQQVLKFKMTENAVITALPFLTLWFFSMGLSKTLDWLRGRGTITTTTARKIGTLFASVIPAICLLAVCYIGCNRAAAVALMAIGITSIGGMFCGFLSNHIDIAPNFAGTLMAITNTVATIPGIVVPIFVGELTKGNKTISAWRIVFFVTIGLYVLEILAYTIFGSGEQQPWNNVEEKADENEVEAKPLNNDTEKSHV